MNRSQDESGVMRIRITKPTLARTMLWAGGCVGIAASAGFYGSGAGAVGAEPFMDMAAMLRFYCVFGGILMLLLLPVCALGAALALGGGALLERRSTGGRARIAPSVADRVSVVAIAIAPWSAVWGVLGCFKYTSRPSVDIVRGKPAWIDGWFVQTAGSEAVFFAGAVVIALVVWPLSQRVLSRIAVRTGVDVCRQCGYSLAGIVGVVCPECGSATDRERSASGGG